VTVELSARFMLDRSARAVSAAACGEGRFRVAFCSHHDLLTVTELELDDRGLAVLSALTAPSTMPEIATRACVPIDFVIDVVQRLGRVGLVRVLRGTKESESRYRRHLQYFTLLDVDPEIAQEKIGRQIVCLLGMGGIGTNIASILIGMGVRELRLVDPDSIELSNLTRQVLYRESDVGRKKVGVAADVLRGRNSETRVTPIDASVSREVVCNQVQGSDFIFVSADSPKWIHSIVGEASETCDGIPFCPVGYYNAVGVAGPIWNSRSGSCCNCYRQRYDADRRPFPGKAEENWRSIEEHYQAPSYGPLNALMSSIAVAEFAKYCVGIESALIENHVTYNSVSGSLQVIPGCGRAGCTRGA
jgi:molybdopterin/thiamine biosynthesis adenylyltransferase